ncbi:MAG: hypothetical protein PHI12_09135 [Dehalococcoidales bacterium]|nr:hypothetical protein [Dehalococcoidales bacterium]
MEKIKGVLAMKKVVVKERVVPIVGDGDVYVRYTENSRLLLDFSGGSAQASSITKF